MKSIPLTYELLQLIFKKGLYPGELYTNKFWINRHVESY